MKYTNKGDMLTEFSSFVCQALLYSFEEILW